MAMVDRPAVVTVIEPDPQRVRVSQLPNTEGLMLMEVGERPAHPARRNVRILALRDVVHDGAVVFAKFDDPVSGEHEPQPLKGIARL